MRGVRLVVAAALLGVPAAPVAAQSVDPLHAWVALDAPPGDEHLATDRILAANRGWTRDASGNLLRVVGQGSPRRVIACGIDSPGFVVSAITDAGYLRVHRTGNALPHPLFDQFHESQQVLAYGGRGPVPGVVAIANGHFSRQHRGDTTVVGVDELWIDIGARSRADAMAMGVGMLDPVRRDLPAWSFAGHVAGPDVAGRIGCAAVVSTASAPAGSGTRIHIVSTRRTFSWAGLGSALARLGPVDEITVVGPAATNAPPVRRVARPGWVPATAGVDSVTWRVLPTRFTGSQVETVVRADADALRDALGGAAWAPLGSARSIVSRARDGHTETAAILTSLAELPGVSGNEWRVRDRILAALPAWARQRATVDSLGNLIVAAGPDRDTVLFIAHMDEVGYTVQSIRGDGIVVLASRGGVIPSAWEGQPAVLDLRAGPVHGVFVPRMTAARKRPDAVEAWFGLDSATLAQRGVVPGIGVTAFKRGLRLGPVRYTARSLDDRAGSTALLLAARAIDPTTLPHKVLLVWSVREEGGLEGARAIARRIGPSLTRVYAIDTFVSSDTPLEQPTFAYAPLGMGAVLRGLDDGLIAPRAERDRVVRIARAAGIPLQVGTTHGSTDATPFTALGAPGMGLSWPGRYSHSPGEVLDLRDLDALRRLIHAVATSR